MDAVPPLTGYRVIDLSQYIPGPYATRLLADLGAEVIKIEPPAGDPMRRFMAGDDRCSAIYRHLNRGKRIARLNLKESTGRKRFEALLGEADVLLESYRPGVLARLGFNHPRLQRLNPRLVHCALSGFGQNGPYHHRAGHDLTYCAVAGALSFGNSDPPQISFPPIADHAGALQAVNAILAALLGRERSGSGSRLDISLYEAVLSWQYIGLLALQQPQQLGDAVALLSGGQACYNLYQTADQRYVALAALEEKFWQRFCQRVERPEWLQRQHEPIPQQQLIGLLRRLFASQSLAYWCDLLESADCCFEAVPLPGEIAAHPQRQARSATGEDPAGFIGWIDGSPVSGGSEMVELAAGEPIHWRR